MESRITGRDGERLGATQKGRRVRKSKKSCTGGCREEGNEGYCSGSRTESLTLYDQIIQNGRSPRVNHVKKKKGKWRREDKSLFSGGKGRNSKGEERVETERTR